MDQAIERVTNLFNIKYPIIQGGMIWNSGWRLASAVSNSGGLGLIGAGSMYPDIFLENIQKCKIATDKPFGVNLPLLYPNMGELIEIIEQEKIKIVFTSAGNPATYTEKLKSLGCIVVHVVSSSKFALKAESCGVDAVVAEGFEAGGHNGREETTTLCLIPSVVRSVKIPVIAAGGIALGSQMAAVIALGASGVQIGSRFACSFESSSHMNFKKKVVELKEGDTQLTLKELTPVRMIKNKFYEQVQEAYSNCATKDELAALLGRGRAKKGMFEGDLDEGELEIGQCSALIDEILTVEEIFKKLISEYNQTIRNLSGKELI